MTLIGTQMPAKGTLNAAALHKPTAMTHILEDLVTVIFMCMIWQFNLCVRYAHNRGLGCASFAYQWSLVVRTLGLSLGTGEDCPSRVRLLIACYSQPLMIYVKLSASERPSSFFVEIPARCRRLRLQSLVLKLFPNFEVTQSSGESLLSFHCGGIWR